MDNLNPLLAMALEIQRQLKSGLSLRTTLNQMDKKIFNLILLDFEKYQKKMDFFNRSEFKALFFEILQDGLLGRPIAHQIDTLVEELYAQGEQDVEMHLRKLPFLSLMPLLFFIFPALLMVILFPLIQGISDSMEGF